LITPHVIRNLNESRYVSEEFKAKLNAVRNELERMERERAKSQPKLPPREMPPPVEPKPSEETPPPFTPSRFEPRRGAQLSPDPNSITMLSNAGAPPITAQPRPAAVEASVARSVEASPTSPSVTAEAMPELAVPTSTASSATPAYILSLGQHQPAAPVPVSRPSSESQSQRKQNRQWAVQVAALADRKDADAMAAGLQKNGYEAYVMTAHAEGKTWYRVRVGQYPDVASAKQLRQALAAAPQFKGAYVAAN
jgi:cell division septation protein DedD